MLKTFFFFALLIVSSSACCRCIPPIRHICLPQCCLTEEGSGSIASVEELETLDLIGIAAKGRFLEDCECHYVPPLGIECTCPFKK